MVSFCFPDGYVNMAGCLRLLLVGTFCLRLYLWLVLLAFFASPYSLYFALRLCPFVALHILLLSCFPLVRLLLLIFLHFLMFLLPLLLRTYLATWVCFALLPAACHFYIDGTYGLLAFSSLPGTMRSYCTLHNITPLVLYFNAVI